MRRLTTAIVLVGLLLVALLMSGSAVNGLVTAGTVDIAAYYPGAMARTHDLVAGDGARTRYHFPSAWDPERGGMFGRQSEDCTDWHVWLPEALHYLGLYCGPKDLSVTILPLTLRALPRRTELPWSQTSRAWEVTIADGVASTGPADEMRVSLARDRLEGEPAIVLRFARRNGSGETWWFVDCLAVVPEGGCAPGVRQHDAVNEKGAMVWHRRYARWERR
jgi:hypothetical protein